MWGIDNQLLVTVGANAVSAAVIIIGGLFVLFQNWRRDVNYLFFFITIGTFFYTLFFILAALQTDYDAAYFWWFLNICDVFITMAVVHFVFRISDQQIRWRWFIILVDIVGLIIFAAAWVYPTAFLPTVEPKLYFNFYLTAGWLYSVMVAYVLLPPLIAFINLLSSYRQSSGVQRQRLEYIIIMLIVGYAIGSTNFLLVYDILFDPIFGSMLGLYLIPIAYGIYSTDLLDIRLVFRRAFYYSLSIAGITAFLMALILLNGFLVSTVPYVQFWTVPFIVAIVAFVIGRSVLRQAQESEKLKYEFITVATHKLRTPLTRIRWVIPELLAKVGDNKDLRDGIGRIDDANNRLIELTNVLLESARPGGSYDYQQIPVDLRAIAWDAVKHFATQISEKKLVVTVGSEQVPQALGDRRRLALVAEILVENAVMYTPASGKINITVTTDRNRVRFAVADTGMGVNREDQDNIFSSFYRTNSARTADTEGVGLGLSLAKNIIERQNGRIGVMSEGEGHGSIFWFSVPIAKE